jgi:hypothetical protein
MKFSNSLKIYTLINQILLKHNIDLELRMGVDLNIHKGENLIGWNRSDRKIILPIDKISDFIDKNILKPIDTPSQNLFHYLPDIKFLENILTKNEIRLYSLNKYLINGDRNEYRCFLETFGIDFQKFETQIEKIKQDIFIWCLTTQENSERHWNEYANNKSGVAISVEFSKFTRNDNSFNLIPVNYGLDFLSEIHRSLRQEFDVHLEILKYSKFAKYFKQNIYKWESEVRLCLDAESLDIHYKIQDFFKNPTEGRQEIQSMFTIYNDENENRYIQVPLKNKIFEIKIKQIFCSKNHENQVRKIINGKAIELILTN